MASTLRVDTLTDTANTYQINTTSIKFAYCNMYYSVNDAAGSLTIATTGNGTQMSFNKVFNSTNISANTTSSTWTHSYTGKYQITCSYRQDTGADLWTVMGVTKNGNNVAVGVSARVGSQNAGAPIFGTVVYNVDDTTATYQLQQWATSTKTVLSDFSGGSPGWTNYASLVGNTTGDIGRMVDYIIVRIGD